MLTKYFIEIDGIREEVPQHCLKNWDEIECDYKRAGFSGVTRSFTSQFEFVGEMYDKLMTLYLRDGINAHATLSLFTITDRWEWEEQFTTNLDFSSVEWDNYILKIFSIDDSLASKIKARKGTKYEFVVGQDIPVSDILSYDRITLPNSVSHEIMGNGDETDGNSITGGYHKDGSVTIISSSNLKRLPTYIVGNAVTYENSPILYKDEDDSSGSYFIKIEKATTFLNIDIDISFNGNICPRGAYIKNAEIYLMKFDASNPNINSNYINLGTVLKIDSSNNTTREFLGCFPSLAALKKAYPNPPQNIYAIIGTSNKLGECEAVYYTPTTLNGPTEWIQGPLSFYTDFTADCLEQRFRSKFDLSSYAVGSMFALVYKCTMGWDKWYDPISELHFSIKSKITTRWSSKAKPISIDALTPTSICKAVLGKITDNKLNTNVIIDNTDSRIDKTRLFAAESIRNIPGAKFYTTFNDFCDWMETVFGYTYYLGPRVKAQFQRLQKYSMMWILSSDNHVLHTPCPGGHFKDVVRIKGTPYFAVLGEDRNPDQSLNFYTKWEGSELYNDPTTGKARLDTLFYDENYNGCYFNSEYTYNTYPGDVNKGIVDSQTIHFVPRNSIFAGSNIIKIANATEIQYTINTDIAYSKITIGYNKQEYEAECGRDEWNFSAQYNTGIDKLEKSLTLSSKYRADCYGFEFLAQERAKDTTDNKSDNTVFFAYCSTNVISTDVEGDNDDYRTRTDDDSTNVIETTTLAIDRSDCEIVGALSNDVFNGQYSPCKCAYANAAYIAAGLCPSILKFASFDGNTDVCIDGVYGNADIPLNEQLFTLGELEFISPDVDTELDVNALYEVQSNGITYRGFIKEVSFKYANNETAKYNLIVKDIEL